MGREGGMETSTIVSQAAGFHLNSEWNEKPWQHTKQRMEIVWVLVKG